MELHDGRLEIESVEGKGTIVTAWLPAARLLSSDAESGS